MALPDRLERVGIVVGSIVLLTLLVGPLLMVLVPDILNRPAWFQVVVWLLPGTVVGLLVASDRLPATYREVWLFSVLSWLVTFGLWQAVGGAVPPTQEFVGLATWALAVVFAGFVTWRREWLLGTIATDPDHS